MTQITERRYDMSDIIGQEHAKRAIEVAAVGGFNVLLSGNSGNGKTMLAEVYASMLGKYTSISISDTVKSLQKKIETEIGYAAVIVEDLPEYRRDVLVYLKEQLIVGSFTVIATMQPCPCGCLGDPRRQCTCTAAQAAKYRSNIPLSVLDLFDIHIEIPPVPYHEIIDGIIGRYRGESTEKVLERITKAKTLCLNNGNINPDHDSVSLLATACQRLGFSVKSTTKILKVARAIACMDGSDIIRPHHVSEAIQYRTLEAT